MVNSKEAEQGRYWNSLRLRVGTLVGMILASTPRLGTDFGRNKAGRKQWMRYMNACAPHWYARLALVLVAKSDAPLGLLARSCSRKVLGAAMNRLGKNHGYSSSVLLVGNPFVTSGATKRLADIACRGRFVVDEDSLPLDMVTMASGRERYSVGANSWMAVVVNLSLAKVDIPAW